MRGWSVQSVAVRTGYYGVVNPTVLNHSTFLDPLAMLTKRMTSFLSLTRDHTSIHSPPHQQRSVMPTESVAQEESAQRKQAEAGSNGSKRPRCEKNRGTEQPRLAPRHCQIPQTFTIINLPFFANQVSLSG